MKTWGWGFLLLNLPTLLLALPVPAPRMVMTETAVCLLGFSNERPSVTCWMFWGGREVSSQPLQLSKPIPVPATYPLALTGTSIDVCVLEGTENNGRIQCYDLRDDPVYDLNDFRTGSLSDSRVIAGDRWSALAICEADVRGRISCQTKSSGASSSPSDAIRASLVRPGSLAVGGRVGCALDDAGAVHCWPLVPEVKACADHLNRRAPHLSNPADLLVQVGYRARECHACALDTGRVVCWGTSSREFAVPGLRQLPDDVRGGESPLFSIEQDSYDNGPWVDSTPSFGSLLHEGSLWKFPETAVRLPGHAILSSVGKRIACHADAQTLTCSTRTGSEQVQVQHHMALNALGLESLAEGLRRIVPLVYAPKAPLLRKASELAMSVAADAETREGVWLFLANAVAPLVEGNQSEYFRERVIPSFRILRERSNARYGVKTLRDIQRSVGIPYALSLLRESLPWLRSVLASTPLGSATLSRFQSNLGVAIATGTEGASVATLARDAAALSPLLGDGDIANTVKVLLNYL